MDFVDRETKQKLQFTPAYSDLIANPVVEPASPVALIEQRPKKHKSGKEPGQGSLLVNKKPAERKDLYQRNCRSNLGASLADTISDKNKVIFGSNFSKGSTVSSIISSAHQYGSRANYRGGALIRLSRLYSDYRCAIDPLVWMGKSLNQPVFWPLPSLIGKSSRVRNLFYGTWFEA